MDGGKRGEKEWEGGVRLNISKMRAEYIRMDQCGARVGHSPPSSLLDPGARILLILPFSGGLPDPANADIFYYSPRQSPIEHGITLTRQQGVLVTDG